MSLSESLRPRPSGRVNSKAAACLAVLLAALVGLAALMERRAGDELYKARELVAAGDYLAADRHYFQALNWYAPWGSSQAAADELYGLALNHLKSGRKAQALQSLLRLRSALLAARSLYQPRRDLLDAASPLIALSLAEMKLGEGAPRELILAKAAFYQLLYSDDPARDQRWLYMIVFSFLLWTGSAFCWVFSFFRERGPLDPPRRRREIYIPLAVTLYGYLTWLFSMSMS